MTTLVSDDVGAIVIRHLRPTDRGALTLFDRHLSDRTLRMRFMATSATLAERYAEHLTTADDHLALVAELDGRIVGVVSCELDRHDPAVGEMAIVIEDDVQGRGIGRRLLTALVDLAKEQGMREITAEILRSNRRMWRLVESLGLPVGVSAWHPSDSAHVRIQLPCPAPTSVEPDVAAVRTGRQP